MSLVWQARIWQVLVFPSCGIKTFLACKSAIEIGFCLNAFHETFWWNNCFWFNLPFMTFSRYERQIEWSKCKETWRVHEEAQLRPSHIKKRINTEVLIDITAVLCIFETWIRDDTNAGDKPATPAGWRVKHIPCCEKVREWETRWHPVLKWVWRECERVWRIQRHFHGYHTDQGCKKFRAVPKWVSSLIASLWKSTFCLYRTQNCSEELHN